MAKKKKPAANPARGFATTSIASKPKANEEAEKPQTDAPLPKGGKLELDTRTTSKDATAPESVKEKELHELTPEELTERLEQNELQRLVDTYGPKVRREVSRLDSKLRADSRVLRSQADNVSLRRWLPEELMLEILDTIQKERNDENKHPMQLAAVNHSDEMFFFRCWTLWESLIDFGMPTEHVVQAVRAVIENPPQQDAGSYVWGFKESMDLLAVDLEESQLPSYDGRKSRPGQSITTSTENSAINTPAESAFTSPETSPKYVVSLVRIRPYTDVGSRPTGWSRRQPEESDGSEQIADIDINDFESDEEPEDLVSFYLSIKERLYKHRPEIVESSGIKGKKGKSEMNFTLPSPLKTNERRLQMKMKTIESDMLFDKHEAEQRWSLRRIQLMQEAASARASASSTTDDMSTARSDTKPTTHGEADEDSASISSPAGSTMGDDVMLGDMLVSAEDTATAESAAESTTESSVKIRDMGKMTGLSAKRILEDACRGRDGRAVISYKMVSRSTYISRHSLTVSWSTDQDAITSQPVPFIQIMQKASSKGANLTSSMTFTMTEVANPDSKQSEAFIATVALYYIMCTSSKEEKQYLKLPPAFRDLYLELVEHQKQGADAADRETVKLIKEMIDAHVKHQEEDGVVLSAAFRNRGTNSSRPGSSRGASPSCTNTTVTDKSIAQIWHSIQSSHRFQQMLPTRMNLPMFGFKEAALAAIDQSQVIILCGETGCGKSTQLPSYLLEHQMSRGKDCKIYCTQPRRISAISLAQRVSEELGEQVGDVGTSRSLVGYAIRLESKISSRTRLVYATVGVVLRMLESSKSLNDITHLVIDEVHERSIDTDFLLIVLRALMQRRPELKVILMSATVDASKFSAYLNGAPIINVPGRTFPVHTKFLEDAIELTGFTSADVKSLQGEDDDGEGGLDGGISGIPKQLQGYSAATRTTLAQYDEYRIDFELIVRLMEQIAVDPSYTSYSRATLVFLPGIAEIRELNDLLSGSAIFQQQCWVIPLHSTIASEDQQLAFRIPPPGVRKVVLATNIAETGITIPDVTCVIDTGKHKEMRFDERRQLSRLIQSFISRANAKQRRGRAGRVQEGLCFHLFTKHRHDEMIAEQQTPEMLRLSLQDLVMRVKICGLGQIEETLAQALDPPLAKNVRRAIETLIEVGALTSGEDLTTLGSQLAKLPLDANLGKLCLMSAVFGCLDVGLTISAILSSKSPFITPFGDRQRADNARLAFSKGNSDLLTAYNAYTTWRRISHTPHQSVHSFCRKNYLSRQNLTNIEDLKNQLLSSLADVGIVKSSKHQLSCGSRGKQSFVDVPTELDGNSTNEIVVATVIAWSFYPKLLVRDGRGYRNVANSQQVSLHPTSVNKGNKDVKFLSYYSMMASSMGAKYYNALSTTAVADLPLLLMVGDVDWKLHAGVVVIDGNRLRFKVGSWKDAMVLKVMRLRMHELVDGVLKNPSTGKSSKLTGWLEYWKTMCETFEERNRKTG
jgi:ATP-dependent RNA helicase DHX29